LLQGRKSVTLAAACGMALGSLWIGFTTVNSLGPAAGYEGRWTLGPGSSSCFVGAALGLAGSAVVLMSWWHRPRHSLGQERESVASLS
jgi:hypothetical protein